MGGKIDFNNDGIADILERHVHADLVREEMAIVLEDGGKVYFGTTDTLDRCDFTSDNKIWNKYMAFVIQDQRVEFFDKERKHGFRVGDWVVHKGETKQIGGFRIMIDKGKSEVSHTVALFYGKDGSCDWSEIDELKKAQPKPQSGIKNLFTGPVRYVLNLLNAGRKG